MSALPERAPAPPEPERIAYTVSEACKALGVSRSTIWRAVRDGKLVATNSLGPTLISSASVRALFGRAA